MAAAAKRIAVIWGAGPGTGASIARALAKTHHLVLLSRSLPGSLPLLKLDTKPEDLVAATYDGSAASIAAAIDVGKKKWPGASIDVGIVHASAQMKPGSFLDHSAEDFATSLSAVAGAWDFSQALIRDFLANEHFPKGTLLFSSATGAWRGGARFSVVSPAVFARRSLSQSLSREFAPQGIHVANVIIDGVIDIPRVRERWGEQKEEGTRLDPEDIAQVYVDLINQKPTAWTQELDVRPWKEKW
ncbi:putative oxidoreductase [Vanrija pseudolonga]|uniref:Purtative oxidoreductase n=1 Tax=Vanrija pseudolonga TaxID=143232 RepID=A0AAF0YD25_9TREE|nr:purtative oxidoreductase [Vanrija pseudolonga]